MQKFHLTKNANFLIHIFMSCNTSPHTHIISVFSFCFFQERELQSQERDEQLRNQPPIQEFRKQVMEDYLGIKTRI